MDERELGRVLSGAPPAARGWFCPDDYALSTYVDAPADTAARHKLVRHLAGCAYCRQQVAALVKLRDEPLPEVPASLLASAVRLTGRPKQKPTSRFLRAPVFVGAAACFLLAFAAIPLVQSPLLRTGASTNPVQHRDFRSSRPQGAPPLVEFPKEGATLSPSGVEFRWQPSAGLSYRVTVVTADGDVKWQEDTRDTSLHLPANTLAAGKYFVSVAASVEDGKSARSQPVGFEISR